MRKMIVRGAGVLFALAGIWLLLRGCWIFTGQIGQLDWVETEAAVVSTAESVDYGGYRGRAKTVYTIGYTYTVDGIRYDGTVRETVDYRAVGEYLTIKYDPADPAACTDILRPSVPALLLNILAACVFILFGLAASGLLKRLRTYREERRKKCARNS